MSSRGGGDSGGGLTDGRRPLVQQGHEQDAFAAARLSRRAQCSPLRCHCGVWLGFAKVRGEASMAPCLTRLRPVSFFSPEISSGVRGRFCEQQY
uniref:Uncharacterized protein n=1 Tax=Oryza meridionalis TaxID=40149 RepID=A0A0E0EFR5_9ORYZ